MFGISVNGRCRGQATRIMINLGLWRPLKVKDIDNAYAIFLEGRAKKVLNIRREEVERKLEVKELEIDMLQRLLGQKGSKDGLLAHIIGIYARLSDTNEIITGMESDQREMSATIDSLKIAIRREQQKTATAKRSITAQKGMITKRLNALDLETSNRDTEWMRKSGVKLGTIATGEKEEPVGQLSIGIRRKRAICYILRRHCKQ